MAHRGPERALVHVLLAQLAGVGRGAAARVAVDAVHALRAVLAQVTWAVVHVLLAVGPSETFGTGTLVSQRVQLLAGPSVLARRRVAGDVVTLAVLAGVAWLAHARVRAVRVEALAVHARVGQALHDVLAAGGASEAGRARALVR